MFISKIKRKWKKKVKGKTKKDVDYWNENVLWKRIVCDNSECFYAHYALDIIK